MEPENKVKKFMNLGLQFQPYIIVWWSLWIILNDYIKTHCNAKVENCYVPDWRRDPTEFGEPPEEESPWSGRPGARMRGGCRYYDGIARSRDLVSCPFRFSSDKAPQGAVPLVVASSGVIVITVVFITLQFFVLYQKVRQIRYGTLAYIVWLEVAKEPGSLFYRLTQATALIMLASSSVSVITSGMAYSEGDVL
eukprot:gene20936-16399_t